MELQFIGQNVHFAVSLLAALACFAVFWLVFDAWQERRQKRELLKWSGFLALAVGFMINGALIEYASYQANSLESIGNALSVLLRAAGYILVIAGQLLDPLLDRPVYKNVKKKSTSAVMAPGLSSIMKLIILPVLPFVAAFLYYRRATTGLERHLRSVAYAFLALTLYELLTAIGAWQGTDNPVLYRIIANYGSLWWLAQLSLLASGLILGRWVWQYLTKRILSQLFMVLVTATVIIYFVSTGAFSFMLLKNTRNQALSDLSTSSKVLSYALSSQQSEIAAQAEALASKSAVSSAIISGNQKLVANAAGDYAVHHKLTSLVITDGNGRVLYRAEDPERWGDSLSSDTLVQRALIGRIATSVSIKKGVVAPAVN